MPDNREEASFLGAIFETVSQPLLVLDAKLKVELANPAFLRLFQVDRKETEGRLVYDLGNGQWNIAELHRLLEDELNGQRWVENYRVEHTFETIGERIMLLNAQRMHLRGGADRILLAISDVTERERLLFELEGRKEFAEKLIDSVREALVVLGWDLRVHSANQAFHEMFAVDPAATRGCLLYELGNGQWDIPEFRVLLEDILPSESSFDDYEVEHDFETIGRRVMLLNGRRLDHMNLVLLAIRDVTEQRQAEARQQAFVGELQHRVKNILNNVRALARQTSRGARSVDEFFKAFEARLGPLSRAQDLLVRSPSAPAQLVEIVRLELEAVGAREGPEVSIEGPPVLIAPQNVQALAMTIHELTTNAAKYGALSIEAARIEIAWDVERRNDQDHLRFRWQEHGVRIENPEPAKGFGTSVIEDSLPYLVGGTAELTFGSDGVVCRLDVPLP